MVSLMEIQIDKFYDKVNVMHVYRYNGEPIWAHFRKKKIG